ncbi:hypothetical protein [Deinococcus sp. Marseille-Q6407]|uniref:hypothetical protein n=1 Tax=Deinococcus sp. Marseille-Q6407 TaxID=2969223 RepID=UPI0021BE1499|nr:hypothetical protein [Deinococcus sp. Marseille-Q6407]
MSLLFPRFRLPALGASLLAFSLSACTMSPANNAIPATDLRIWPPSVTLAPGQKQTVMLDLNTREGAGPGPYVISVDQVPGTLEILTEPEQLSSKGRVYLTLKAAEHA